MPSRAIRLAPLFIAIFSLIFILAQPAAAQNKLFNRAEKTQKKFLEMAEQEDTVEVYAMHQHYDAKTGIATLEGAVDIRFGEVRLRADKITFNRRTMETVATGNVILEYLENRIVGNRLEMNLRTRLAKVYSAQAFLEPSFYITAEKLERFKLDRYRLHHATFTSCAQDVPDWSFRIKRATIHVDNYIYLYNGSAWVKKMPILYLPYWIYPIKPDRTTGFLMPEFGSNSRLGNYIKDSFFWATTDNTDATFSLQYYDEGTFAQDLEFRYVLSESSGGSFYAFHVSEKLNRQPDPNDTTSVINNPSERWRVIFQHTQDLGMGFRAIANVNYVSDKQFGDDFVPNLSDRPQEVISEVSLTKSWSQYYLSANVVDIESLDEEDPTDTSLQKLPEINFMSMRQTVFETPLLYQFSVQASNLAQTTGLNSEPVERTTKRFDLYPQLSYPLNFGQWLSLTGRVGFRTTWYIDSTLDLSELGARDLDGSKIGKVKTYSFLADHSEILFDREDGEIFDMERPFERVVRNGNDLRREIYDFTLNCTGPSLHRIFSFSGWGDIEKIEHQITPSVSFDYIPGVNQDLLYEVDLSTSHLISLNYPLNYDSIDSIGIIYSGLWGRTQITYSLMNRLRAKIAKTGEDGEPVTDYRDLLSFSLSQSYDFKRAHILKKSDYNPFSVDYSPYSDIAARAIMRPTEYLDGELQMSYNHHKNRISNYTVAAKYHKNTWHAECRFRSEDKYRTIADPDGSDLNYPDTRYFTTEFGCAPHPKWEFYTTVKYNIVDDLFNQNSYTVVYHSQCWSLTFFASHETEIEWEWVDNIRQEKERRSDTQFSLSITLTNVGSSKVPFL
ncbi:MAG: LPS-assembly protein LptD [Candidatus Coatesbacteria bacterium]|nr:LPS-assembly protein LptD [Candidatus Coatesbacteria bacterium]